MSINRYPLIRFLGEDSILVEFEEKVDWGVNAKVRRLLNVLEAKKIDAYRTALPSYRSLLVYFDPHKISDDNMMSEVSSAINTSQLQLEPEARLFRLPTVYGGIHGPDVDRVAEFSNITADDVIKLSANLKLPIYFLGYICSQAYMGDIPIVLQAPRHKSPRTSVPGGSFGFGGPQANILAVDSPSGLNYVGRTFVKVFNAESFPPTAFCPGDYVQCYAVDEETAIDLGSKPMEEFIEPLRDC
jgi:KipI family sensor histidine kinase inhibitor